MMTNGSFHRKRRVIAAGVLFAILSKAAQLIPLPSFSLAHGVKPDFSREIKDGLAAVSEYLLHCLRKEINVIYLFHLHGLSPNGTQIHRPVPATPLSLVQPTG